MGKPSMAQATAPFQRRQRIFRYHFHVAGCAGKTDQGAPAAGQNSHTSPRLTASTEGSRGEA